MILAALSKKNTQWGALSGVTLSDYFFTVPKRLCDRVIQAAGLDDTYKR